MTPEQAKFAALASESHAAAQQLLEKLSEGEQRLATVIIGFVSARLYSALSDLAGAQGVSGESPESQRRRQIMERSDAIRRAGAEALISGDWSEFDRLATGDAGGSAAGGDAA